MAFYQILQEIMNEKGMRVADVARACNLPDSTVRSILARKNESVALEVAFKLSKGLDVSLERLNNEYPEDHTSESGILDVSDQSNKLPEAESSRDNTQFIITDTQERGLVTTYRALSPSGKEKLLSSAKDISILDQYKQEMQHYGSIAADTGGPGRLVRIPDETFNKNKKK